MPWYTTAHTRRDAERQAAQRSKTMTNDEMLDKAAKAAGIKRRSVHWNPLEDDGDALRLACKLSIQVTPGVYRADEATAYSRAATEAHEYVSFTQDMETATRRAIVRAAAAMCTK